MTRALPGDESSSDVPPFLTQGNREPVPLQKPTGSKLREVGEPESSPRKLRAWPCQTLVQLAIRLGQDLVLIVGVRL